MRIISNQIEKTKPYKVNYNILIINQEKRDIWQIPDKNYLDVIYLIKEEKQNDIINNNQDIKINNNINDKYFDKNNTMKNNMAKNLVLYKKVNENDINKKNKNYKRKNNNIINLKINDSNDITKWLSPKKAVKNQKEITQIINKKISFDYNDNYTSNVKDSEMNDKSNKTLYNKRVQFNDNNDEQSYAFQNLVNLNKKEKNEEKLRNIDINNKSYKIEIKRPFHKKRLEKSPESIKFCITEAKNYCLDEKMKNNNKKNDYGIQNIDTIVENNINKSKNRTIINENKNDDNNNNHKTIQINHINEKNNLEYDGDMETVTVRYYSSAKNKKGSYNKKRKKHSSVDNKNRHSIRNLNVIDVNNTKNIEIIEHKAIKINNINYETFCSGFFVSGIPIPIKEDSIIHDSNNFISPCGHKLCSLLFSIRPEILYYYNNQNFKISEDLLKKISGLSFPLGAKICIECSFENKIMIEIPQQTFYNVIENNKGEKLYICTKYYYINIKSDDFKKIYKFEISSFFSEISKNNNKSINNNNFKNYILTASRLLNGNSSLYIPESITLLSKSPFLIPMSICLNGFISSLIEERKNVINHIINEVPTPTEIGPQIRFYIPVYSSPIILNNKCNIYKKISKMNKENQKEIFEHKYLSMEQLNYPKLFEMISVDYIIFIFSMILLEQKILLIYNNYEILSQIIFIFISLIYPFSYEKSHIFPIISLDSINLVEKTNSFIAGMDESLLYYIYNNNIVNIKNNNIIIYNIRQKCFFCNKNKKKMNRKELLHEYKLFPMPEKIINFLTKELKIIVKKIKTNQEMLSQKKMNEKELNFYKQFCLFNQNVEIYTKIAFIKSMIMLIGDVNNFTFYMEEEKLLFNKELFIESHKDKDFKNYLNQILNTTLFNNFLDNLKRVYFSKRDNIYERDSYNEIFFYITSFIKLLSQFPEIINNEQLTNIRNKNIMNSDIYIKAQNICNKLTLINNINKNVNNSKNNQNENFQINKKKTNVFFSGKNYLEDKPEVNIQNYSEKHLDEYKSFSHTLKESKISTESTTLNTYYNSINKNDIKDIKESNNEKQKILYIDINTNRKLLSNKYNDKKKLGKIFLLVPYFLYFKGDENEENQAESIILKDIIAYKRKKNIKDKNPPLSTLVTTISKPIDYNSYNIKNNKIYMINCHLLKNDNIYKNNKNNNILKDSVNISNEVKTFTQNYFKEEINEKDLINLKNIYENDDEMLLINKSFKSCFINKPEMNNQHLFLLKKLFSNFENLEYFANLIVPKIVLKNRNYNIHKQLTILSYNIFSKIMELCFENSKSNDNKLGRLLTLACFIYYKIEKDKIIYLYSNFAFNKSDISKQNFKPYKLWNTESFWIEFFNSEFENNSQEKDNDDDIYDDIYENENNDEIDIKDKNNVDWRRKMCLIKTVIEVINIMNKLNLGKYFIINIIEKMILPVFVNDFVYINRIMNLALTANNVN